MAVHVSLLINLLKHPGDSVTPNYQSRQTPRAQRRTTPSKASILNFDDNLRSLYSAKPGGARDRPVARPTTTAAFHTSGYRRCRRERFRAEPRVGSTLPGSGAAALLAPGTPFRVPHNCTKTPATYSRDHPAPAVKKDSRYVANSRKSRPLEQGLRICGQRCDTCAQG